MLEAGNNLSRSAVGDYWHVYAVHGQGYTMCGSVNVGWFDVKWGVHIKNICCGIANFIILLTFKLIKDIFKNI